MRLWLILFLAALISGCESLNDGPSGAGGNAGASGAPLAAFGRVQTDELVSGASVVALSLDGQPLAGPVTTDATGAFWLRGELPDDYRVVARLPGSEDVLASEVRGPNAERQILIVNAVTNLVSLYLARHPELTLTECEAAIRATLRIPASVSLRFGLGNTRYSYFSHTEFLRDAQAAGGVAVLSEQILDAADAGERLTFVLPRAGLAQVLRQGDGVEAVEDVAEAAEGGLLSTVKATLGANIITDITKSLYGWAAGAMGWNFGTAGELEAIEKQLDQISGQITTLSDDIDTDFSELTNVVSQQNLIGTLTGQKSDLATSVLIPLQGNLQNLITQIQNAPPPTNAPGFINSEVHGLLEAYQVPAAQPTSIQTVTLNQLNTLTANQLGQDQTVNLNATLMALNMIQTGLSLNELSGANLFYDLRSNAVLYSCLDQLSYYEGVQVQAFYLLAEIAHAQLDLADAIAEADGFLANLGETLQLQRQQLPPALPSDDLYVDLENGLIWYRVATPLWDTPSYPVADPPFSYSWDLTTYGDLTSTYYNVDYDTLVFTLPTEAQMQTLIQQAKNAYINNGNEAVNSGSKTKEVLPGLALLGFQGLPDINGKTVDGGSNQTWADRGFFLALMPDSDTPTLTMASGVPDPPLDGPGLQGGYYLPPTYYFSGDDNYHWEEASSVSQGYSESVANPQILNSPFNLPLYYYSVLPGNDPGFALLVAPLHEDYSYWTFLPQQTGITTGRNLNGQELLPQVEGYLRALFTPSNLVAQATSEGITVTATYVVPKTGVTYTGIDVTNQVSFSTDKPQNVTVSNFGGGTVADPADPSKQVTVPPTNGQLTWHTADKSATGKITASLITGYTGVPFGAAPPGHTTISVDIPYGGTNTLQTNLATAPTLQSIMVTPTNQLINKANSGFAVLNLYATGCYSDGSVQDLTNDVTWTVTGAAPSLAFVYGPPAAGQLNLSDQLGLSTLTITAALGSVSGTATIGTAFP